LPRESLVERAISHSDDFAVASSGKQPVTTKASRHQGIATDGSDDAVELTILMPCVNEALPRVYPAVESDGW
jgi:hypothetical protein